MTALVLGSLSWLALAGLATASCWYSVVWRDQESIARYWIGNGSVHVVTERLAGSGLPLGSRRISSLSPGWSIVPRQDVPAWQHLVPKINYPYWGGTLVSVPLWMPMAGLALPLLYGWRRVVRSHAIEGRCTCGYDMTGNTNYICPECGTAYRERRSTTSRLRRI